MGRSEADEWDYPPRRHQAPRYRPEIVDGELVGVPAEVRDSMKGWASPAATKVTWGFARFVWVLFKIILAVILSGMLLLLFWIIHAIMTP